MNVEDGDRERPGSFAVGSHDDLVMALGQAVHDDMPIQAGPVF